MPFRPRPGDSLAIDGGAFTFAANPRVPRFAYSQEGRVARVYRLDSPQRICALKVFKQVHQSPALAALADRLAPFSNLPGMRVCQRTAIVPERHGKLIKQYDDLRFAILMPWIHGPTWHDVVINRRPLDRNQSLALAQALVQVLASLEQQGVAHCDLSAPNVLLPILEGAPPGGMLVELVDIEQMYSPGLPPPDQSMAGSPGYAHYTASAGIWEQAGDRFAGAVLLAEMLGWCSPLVRDVAVGDSFFDPTELQRDSQRYRLLRTSLSEEWGERLALLLDRAWQSRSLSECPPLSDWTASLLALGGMAGTPGGGYGQPPPPADPWAQPNPWAGGQADPWNPQAQPAQPANPWNTPPPPAAHPWNTPPPQQPNPWSNPPPAQPAHPWNTPPPAGSWAAQPWPNEQPAPAAGAFGPAPAGAAAPLAPAPQPRVMPTKTATNMPRGIALVLDLLLSTLLAVGIGLVLSIPLKISYTWPALLIWMAYYTASWTFLSATCGQLVCGLRVVDAFSGQPITFWQSLVRAAAYVLSLASLGVGFLMGLRAPGAASLPDWLARTRVVTTR